VDSLLGNDDQKECNQYREQAVSFLYGKDSELQSVTEPNRQQKNHMINIETQPTNKQ